MAAILSRPHCVFVFVFVFDELYLYLYLYLIRFLPVYLYLYLYLKLRKKMYLYLYLYLIKRIWPQPCALYLSLWTLYRFRDCKQPVWEPYRPSMGPAWSHETPVWNFTMFGCVKKSWKLNFSCNFYASAALRAGGVLSSRFGRQGRWLPDWQNPHLCNRLTDFLHSKFCLCL